MSTHENILKVRLDAPAHGGHTVARHEGRVIFVRHGIPGELVSVAVRDDGEKARFWRGDVVEVHEASADRVPHFWTQADSLHAAPRGVLPVGGAEFGHIALDAQRRIKGQIFVEQMQRLGGIDVAEHGFTAVRAPEGESADGLGWRTRTAFAVDAKGRLAMSAFRSNDLVPVKEMPLAHPKINELALWELPLAGISRIEVAVGSGDDGGVLVLFIEDGTVAGAAGRAAKRLPEGTSAAALTQVGGSAADGRGALQRLRGRTWLSESVAGHDYRITGEGFWQIHRLAPATLVERVMSQLAPGYGTRIADLYAGAGLFSAPLAKAVGDDGMLLSIEGAPGTSKDALKNLREFPQAIISQGRVEKTLSRELNTRKAKLDSIVLDPPRTGAGKTAVSAMVRSGAKKISYVSCDPASFARDTADLLASGFRLEEVDVIDLYPHTHHMETVGLFVRH
ncbi:class I SAM-dependent RNA methyltransferase [Paeniglutamicibacter sulfureus]|uniref:class I SAM-dependent RNA methyltransferase n=1 Tax=Paeniglutamicibacter sulfureus TaxID=43666 RepID=UPI002665C83C|nr:class I SAM-dependent RNA methyltransferase [Paeniglutamicibacter sulfureus]MDO2936423.1 class I SAM-dependent RNA methyltransferase [Paeniglutamicibacter sulfureus]